MFDKELLAFGLAMSLSVSARLEGQEIFGYMGHNPLIFAQFGTPEDFISDRGVQFTKL